MRTEHLIAKADSVSRMGGTYGPEFFGNLKSDNVATCTLD